MTDKVLVLVTCGSVKEARRIARTAVGERLAACVNILDVRVESVYRWKGQVQSVSEFLLLIKTSRRRLAALEAKIGRLHSYVLPEIIALPIVAGSRGYLSWLAESVRV